MITKGKLNKGSLIKSGGQGFVLKSKDREGGWGSFRGKVSLQNLDANAQVKNIASVRKEVLLRTNPIY